MCRRVGNTLTMPRKWERQESRSDNRVGPSIVERPYSGLPSPTMPVGSLRAIQLKGRRQQAISLCLSEEPLSRKLRMGFGRSWSPVTLSTIWDRYQKPLFIVENGLGAVITPNEARWDWGWLPDWLPGCSSGHAGGHLEDGVILWGGLYDLRAVLTWSLLGEMKKRYGFIMSTGTTGQGSLERSHQENPSIGTKEVI